MKLNNGYVENRTTPGASIDSGVNGRDFNRLKYPFNMEVTAVLKTGRVILQNVDDLGPTIFSIAFMEV